MVRDKEFGTSLEQKLKARYGSIKSKQYLFSIIIPIYNVEDYLEETIESIINQTLNFEKHVQMILVNDGSPDNSEEICLHYQKKYPSNILYVKKENGGVSSARNKGIEYATGEIVNFLDSDDILAKDALEKVYEYYSKHKEEIDVVCLPIFYFEARKGQHMLNAKFAKTQIIDIEETPSKIQLHVSSAFISNEQVQQHRFDESLKYGEDAKFVTEIILKKGKYGVLSNAKYYYRIRKSGSSAIQTSHSSEAWYNASVINFSKALIDMSLNKYGYVSRYIQNVVMYDLQWKFRIKEIPTSVLSKEQKLEFIQLITQVLQHIEDDVIFAQKYIKFHHKIFVLKLKYLDSGKDILNYLYLKDNIKIFLNKKMINSLDEQRVYLNLLEIREDKIYIEGMFASGFEASDSEITIHFKDQEIQTEKVSRPLSDIKIWGIVVKEIYGFRAEIDCKDLNKEERIEFVVKINDVKVKLNYKLTQRIPFSKKIPSFYAKDKLILYPGKTHITVVPNTFMRRIKKEFGMTKRLIKLMKIKSGAKKALLVRWGYNLLSVFKKKPIYLFMDRVDKADDNAEVLFRYATKRKDGIKKYFVISEKSSDFNRMKKYGKVVPYGSYRHKLLLLLSDKLISSHADEVIINPFYSTKMYYKDLMTFDYIFLQHGVTQNDLSGWLNKYQKNIKLFITSAFEEYESIINGAYGYSDKEVILSGMPRHDRLVNESKKQILIMPTWRMSLASKLDKNLRRVYNEDFVHTDYFKMYNGLINDERLLMKLKETGYKMKFVIHPALKEQYVDFTQNEYVEILNPDNITYYKLFNESSLMVTDYSSVSFDFAYLRKPILYFHFDQEEFYRNHFTKGYFDYEEKGFGPVIKNFNDMVGELIKAIENDCQLDDLYRERIDSFFAYSDKNNSQRVYDEILKLDKKF